MCLLDLCNRDAAPLYRISIDASNSYVGTCFISGATVMMILMCGRLTEKDASTRDDDEQAFSHVTCLLYPQSHCDHVYV